MFGACLASLDLGSGNSSIVLLENLLFVLSCLNFLRFYINFFHAGPELLSSSYSTGVLTAPFLDTDETSTVRVSVGK